MLRNSVLILNILIFVCFVFQVRDLVNRCTCPAQFPMIREAEGKYRIGENSTLIFVRVR